MLTWGVVAVLAVGVYGQRALGMALVDPERLGLRPRQVLAMVPLSILCAVTALQTLSTHGELVLDARVAGIIAAT
ncbi:MAG: AzlD domain-containing protein, partial [Actinomycetota bacterium]|nr:AzlD domain-containing protein [Actinomycetota bacterium]